jgi:hypothetical protein
MQRPIQQQAWRVRWQRQRSNIITTTLQGAQGGFWGLGLGFGSFLGLLSLLQDNTPLNSVLPRLLITLLSAGIPIAGVVGALAAGGAAFAGAVWQTLQDRPQPWATWGVKTGVGILLLGIGLLFPGTIIAGNSNMLQIFITGALLGLGLIGPTVLPLDQPRLIRLAIGLGGSVAAFLLAGSLGLISNAPIGWLLIMGLVSGFGFFWGLAEKLQAE